MSNKPVFILNGPNLNLLGSREPDIYGHDGIGQLEQRLAAFAKGQGLSIDFRQSNHEGELIEWIHQAGQGGNPLILNAAAYTHTSIALHDALKAVDIIAIEVHLSNIFKREEFRHHSFISPVSKGVISGFGVLGYELALLAIKDSLQA